MQFEIESGIRSFVEDGRAATTHEGLAFVLRLCGHTRSSAGVPAKCFGAILAVSPMSGIESVIWGAFFSNCYARCNFSEYDAVEVPKPILEVLLHLELSCTFEDYLVMANDVLGEYMLVGVGADGGDRYRIARWCCRDSSLRLFDQIKELLLRDFSTVGPLARRYSSNYRRVVLHACREHDLLSA